jgi:hypothetical protein
VQVQANDQSRNSIVTSVVGVICTGGTKGRTNFVPKADAAAVARYSSAMSKLGQAEKNSMRAYVFRFAPEPGHCSTWSALRICETIPQIKLTQPRGTTLINMGVAARIIAGLYFGREILVRSPWLFF